MAENTRELVLNMLLSIEREEAYSHLLIKDVLEKYDYLSGQDKAFMKRLFEGTIERRIEIDYDINQFASIPVKTMKPFIRNLLRMSAYQILFMDGIPDFAAINEAVKLADRHKFHNLKGFVNGVLRKLSAGKDSLMRPEREKNPEEYLSITYSMPEWIVRHFLKEYSVQRTEAILKSFLNVRPVTFRFSAKVSLKEREDWIRQVEEKGCIVCRHPFYEQAYYLKNCENVTNLPGFREGVFTLQDVSSMAAVAAAGIRPGDTVMDVCAAPGGKTILASEYAGKDGHVYAGDISPGKVSLIEEYKERMGAFQVTAKVWDATKFDESMASAADVVIADVPCSGLGVMGRKRDIKYRQKEEHLQEICALQKAIVQNAVRYVKPGGIFLYSTCTINREENEKMAEWLEREQGMIPVSVAGEMKAFPGAVTAEKGYVQLMPDTDDTDGFFFAKFRKE